MIMEQRQQTGEASGKTHIWNHKQETEQGANVMSFQTHKTCLHWHAPFSMATLPKPLQTATPTRNQIFKHSRFWWSFLIQTTTSCILKKFFSADTDPGIYLSIKISQLFLSVYIWREIDDLCIDNVFWQFPLCENSHSSNPLLALISIELMWNLNTFLSFQIFKFLLWNDNISWFLIETAGCHILTKEK